MWVLITAISGRIIPDLFTAATSLLAGFIIATLPEDTISMDEASVPSILAMLTSPKDFEVAGRPRATLTVADSIGKVGRASVVRAGVSISVCRRSPNAEM
jgi:hypothetical protein